MATYTRAQLRNQVMYDLAVLDANEAPTAEDSTLVLGRIQQSLEMLADDGLIPFDLDGDEIPARYMGPLSSFIAPLLAPAFGKHDMLPILLPLAAKGERDLRKLKAQPYFGAPVQTVYF